VRLHQPSASYGVSSRELGDWTKDKTGLNRGLYGLASGAEVLAHFEQVAPELSRHCASQSLTRSFCRQRA